MHKIAANPDTLAESLQSSAIRASLLVIKSEMPMNKIANGLHSSPSCSRGTKSFPCEVKQLAIHFTIPARQKKQERFDRQLLNVGLSGLRRVGI
jgi:hypothetical protein